MLRVFSAAVVGLLLIPGLGLAGDHRGYLKAVEKDKLVVTVEDRGNPGKDDKDKEDKDKDIEIKTDSKTQYFGGKNPIRAADLAKTVKDAEGQGVRVHVITKGTGPDEVATEVRVAAKR